MRILLLASPGRIYWSFRNLGTCRGDMLFRFPGRVLVGYAACHRNSSRARNLMMPLCNQLAFSFHRYMSDTKSPPPNKDPLPSKDPPKEKGDPPEQDSQIGWAQILPGILVVLVYYLTSNIETSEVSFPYFLQHMLNTGEVERLEVNSSQEKVYIYLHRGAVVNGVEVHPSVAPRFVLTIASAESFEAKLNAAEDQLGIAPAHRIPVNYRPPYNALSALVGGAFPLLMLGALWYFMFRRSGPGSKAGGRKPLNPFNFMSKARATVITSPSQVTTKFSDVAGMQEAKQEVIEFVEYLRTPQKYSQLGARIPKGALLYGPPGTGKTMLARAIASEANVPFLSIAGSDFVEMYAGVGSARVRDLFNQAREHAPCILYIDEIDAVGKSRGSGSAMEGHSEQENTLNQLLVEMDGINQLEGVVILASTNRVDILDQALLRPGRFDRQISIELPTLLERKEIFEVYLKKIILAKAIENYSSRLAALTPGKSGADIANIVNEAALHAAREKGKTVTEKDLEYAVERIIVGMEKMSNVLTPAEKEMVAYHEAGHALTAWLLEHTDPILKVSIIPRTKGIFGFSQHLPSDQKLYTAEELFEKMCVALGGRMSEALVFKKITSGAQDDLQKVTKLAYTMIVELGMSEAVGNMSFPLIDPAEFQKRSYSNKLSSLIDEEVRSLVHRAQVTTEALLKNNLDALQRLSKSLLEKEVLNYNDLVAILGPLQPRKLQQHKELQDMW